MFDGIIFMIKFVGIGLGIITYCFQWASLMYEIIDGITRSLEVAGTQQRRGCL